MNQRPRKPNDRDRPTGRWKNGPIPVIGLVGGIGSGKSLAAARFAAIDAFVIDADKVGHALLDQTPVREELVQRFGPDILFPATQPGEEPRIDRKALGAIVFADSAARKALERIVHPRMRRTFEKAIARAGRRGESRAVVLDAAILFEAEWDDLCDRVFFVDSPREARLARLTAQRGWTEADLANREAAQWPLEMKKSRSERILKNHGLPDDLRAEVDRAWSSLRPPTFAKLHGTAATPARAEKGPGTEPDTNH